MCVPRPRSALIKSPRSIAITNDENRILRIPDSGMMFQQQRHLQDMLVDIHTDPGGFKRHIEGMRTTLKSNATAISSPVDVHTGCRDDYEMHQAVGATPSAPRAPIAPRAPVAVARASHNAPRRARHNSRPRAGKGRFSTVFYSREKATSTACAVKRITLSAAQAGNKTSYSKCLKEVGLLRNLAHPNIIKYSDSFLEEDVLFIVLEWAAGGDLKNLIAQIRKEENQLEEHQVWSYFSQCCEAVHHMHGQRIIHRCGGDAAAARARPRSFSPLVLGATHRDSRRGPAAARSLLAGTSSRPTCSSWKTAGSNWATSGSVATSTCSRFSPSLKSARLCTCRPKCCGARVTTSRPTSGASAVCCTRWRCCARRSSRKG